MAAPTPLTLESAGPGSTVSQLSSMGADGEKTQSTSAAQDGFFCVHFKKI